MILNPLQRSFLASFLGHFLILFTVAIFSRITLPGRHVTWIDLPKEDNYKIGIGLKASRDLPKTTIQEQKKRVRAAKKTPKGMTQEVLDPSKAQQKKMEEALARIEQDLETRKAAPPEAAQVPDAEASGTNPLYTAYQAQIREEIMQEWVLPLKFHTETLDLTAQLVVQINNHGEVISLMIEKSSGNAAFDQSAARAVQKASPLSLPPAALQWEALNEGFLIEFKPELVR